VLPGSAKQTVLRRPSEAPKEGLFDVMKKAALCSVLAPMLTVLLFWLARFCCCCCCCWAQLWQHHDCLLQARLKKLAPAAATLPQ
jgi:hypothetical protein